MGDGDVKYEQGAAGPVCPECATPRSERVPAVPWLVRHRVKVKVAAFLLVLGFIVWKNVAVWPAMGTPRTYSTFPARSIAHKYTQGDLARYASGEIADGQLASDVVFGYVLGSYEIEAAFVSPQGTLVNGVWYGWPAAVVSSQFHTTYDDVYARTNPSPGLQISTSGWGGLRYIRQRVDAGNRFEHFVFLPGRLLIPAVVIAIAFTLGSALRGGFYVLRLADKAKIRMRDRFTRRLPVLCAAACTVLIAIASLQPGHYGNQFNLSTKATTPLKTGLTNRDVARLSTTPTGEAEIARAILDAAGATAADPNDVLVIGGSAQEPMTTVERRGAWPDYTWFQTRWTTEASGNGQRHPARVKLSRGYGQVTVYVSRGDPAVSATDLSVFMPTVAKLVLGLLVAWWTPGVAAMIANRWVRRRAVKRVARGWCVRCGYDLGGL